MLPASPIPEEDRLFAKLVVAQSLCTQEAVDECLSTLARLAEGEVTPLPSLGELLRRRGYLQSGQVDTTLRASDSASKSGAGGVPAEVAEAEGAAGNPFGKYVRTRTPVIRLTRGGRSISIAVPE